MNERDKPSYAVALILVGIGFLTLYGVLSLTRDLFHNDQEYVGNYVFTQLEWVSQTKEIMRDKCVYENNGWVGGIYIDTINEKLYCFNNDCKDDYCKLIEVYLEP